MTNKCEYLLEEFSRLEINEETYQTNEVPSDVIPSNYGIEVIYLAFSEQEQLDA